MNNPASYRFRFPLMFLALGILVTATWAGLIRLGWSWSSLQPGLPVRHGPLMVAGFFGTLISLERAVAVGRSWAYIGPLLSGIGGILTALDLLGVAGPVLMTLGSIWLLALYGVVMGKRLLGFLVVMTLGALALLLGNLLWLAGWSPYRFVLWWGAFLVLTIAGERLELGRMVQLSRFSQVAFAVAISVYLIGLVTLLPAWDLGVRIAGVGTIGLSLWLLRFDIARRTVRQAGLTRFIAVCLLSGYVWLLVSGVLSLVYGGVPVGPVYDAMLHAIFLGFVFAMIFGHAPIIFPAVLGVEIAYRSLLYLPLALLHASLLLRIGGEMAGFGWARLWGGLVNVIAVILYLLLIAPIWKLWKKA